MPEIMEPKVGNPKNSTNPNWANLSQPWNLTFLEVEIFQLFFQSYVSKVPEWKIAHIEWSKKVQNIRKSPKNEGFRGTYLIPPFWEHPVHKVHFVIQYHIPPATSFCILLSVKNASKWTQFDRVEFALEYLKCQKLSYSMTWYNLWNLHNLCYVWTCITYYIIYDVCDVLLFHSHPALLHF